MLISLLVHTLRKEEGKRLNSDINQAEEKELDCSREQTPRPLELDSPFLTQEIFELLENFTVRFIELGTHGFAGMDPAQIIYSSFPRKLRVLQDQSPKFFWWRLRKKPSSIGNVHDLIGNALSNSTSAGSHYLLEGWRMNCSSPKKVVVFLVRFNPIFMRRGFPASWSTFTFEPLKKLTDSRD